MKPFAIDIYMKLQNHFDYKKKINQLCIYITSILQTVLILKFASCQCILLALIVTNLHYGCGYNFKIIHKKFGASEHFVFLYS